MCIRDRVNAGKDAGQSIMHCHIHLIPRRKGDVKDPEVSSNPLTIIKPRIIERALETFNSNQIIQ